MKVIGLANYSSTVQCTARVLNVQSEKKYFFSKDTDLCMDIFYFCSGLSPKSMKFSEFYEFKIAAWKISVSSLDGGMRGISWVCLCFCLL